MNWITAGTPRPYTHSLLTVAVILLAALLWRRRRDLLIGIGLGVISIAVAGLLVSGGPAISGASMAAGARYSRLVWHDEFSGPAGSRPDPRRWQIVTGDWSGGDGELEYYAGSQANVALDGRGQLAITARRQTIRAGRKIYRYTSARLQTKGLFQTMYGRLEARVELPAGRGLWPAFWTLGADIGTVGWPGCGEIDVMENHGSQRHIVFATIHGPSAGADRAYGLSAADVSSAALTGRYHTFGVTWSPGKLVFTLDGVPYSVMTRRSLKKGDRWVFDHPFYLLLNLAVGGRDPGNPDPATRFPATMLVDWVRVYR